MGAKLAGLVRARWGSADRRPHGLPGGAALEADGVAWVLAEVDAARALGAALLWADNVGAREVHLIAEAGPGAGLLARRAAAFRPAPSVWEVAGTELAPAEPAPLPSEPPLDPRAAAFADALRAAGVDVVVEHGAMTGEVLGLEVARVIVDDQGAHLQVGVGKHDRHGQQLVHGDVPAEQVLVDVAAAVRDHRRSTAPPHPYQRLATERWLRHRIVAEPGLVGADELLPVPALTPAGDLRRPRPAPAAGLDRDGGPLLAVCSTGFDVDLVPTVVDARIADGRRPRTLVVVPERDDQPALRTLVAALRDPAEIVTVPDDWKQP